MLLRRPTVGTERKAIYDFEGWAKETGRRLGTLDRRPSPRTAQDLLGQGFGPTATLIQDWNDPVASFNGYYYSVENLSLNSPDSGEAWVGIVVAETDNVAGIQEVWTSHSGSPPRRFTRRWSTTGSAVTFTDWIGDDVWQTSGITVVAACTIVEQAWRQRGTIVEVSIDISTTVAFTGGADGNLVNTALLQVPSAIAPVDCPRVQGMPLQAGASGPMATWAILPTGTIIICATSPGLTIPSGSQMTVGGSYSL
jgi:hypothetical protein